MVSSPDDQNNQDLRKPVGTTSTAFYLNGRLPTVGALPPQVLTACFGSLNKNPIDMGKVQRAVEGRLIFLITSRLSGVGRFFNASILS